MPHVAILMATRNGAAFLPAQLVSLSRQTHRDWSLWVSDDGSSDATRAIVRDFAARHPEWQVGLAEGPRRGSTANFLSLLARPVAADLWAFADQDDVWLPGKLARAVSCLAGTDSPSLYGARTIVTDAALRPFALSPLFTRPPGFGNALVQSIAGGNTMVLNAAARHLALTAGGYEPVAHDWWLYQVVSGAGGRVIYDPEPQVLYRQHGRNVIGANMSVGAQASRACAMIAGRLRRWNRQNIAALRAAEDILLPESRARLDAFAALASRWGPGALVALRSAGLYRQTRAGDLSLAAAAILGRL